MFSVKKKQKVFLQYSSLKQRIFWAGERETISGRAVVAGRETVVIYVERNNDILFCLLF